MKRPNDRALSTFKIKKIIFHFCCDANATLTSNYIRHKSQHNKQVFYDSVYGAGVYGGDIAYRSCRLSVFFAIGMFAVAVLRGYHGNNFAVFVNM